MQKMTILTRLSTKTCKRWRFWRDCQQKHAKNNDSDETVNKNMQKMTILTRLSSKWAIWSHLERPRPERPNFSKTAGCKKPYKILCKIAPQTRFQASGSPGTVFEVLGERSQRRRKAILTRLSAKTAQRLAKRTRLSAKWANPEAKDNDSDETVSKNSTETSKTYETVNKMSDPRSKRWRFWRDCQQKQHRD